MTTGKCPDFFIDDKGYATNSTWGEWMINKHKLYKSLEEFYDAAQIEPRKTWKKAFKIIYFNLLQYMSSETTQILDKQKKSKNIILIYYSKSLNHQKIY